MEKTGWENLPRRLTGFINNCEMNKVSIEVFVCSHCLELLEEVRRLSCLDKEILKDGELLKVGLLSVNTTDYGADDIIIPTVEAIQRFYLDYPAQIEGSISLIVDIDIVVPDADEASIPGILFPTEYISLASKLDIKTIFHLMITSSTIVGTMNSGAYLYIESDSDINVPVLNMIAGTQPSVVYRKGCMGRYTVLNFNSWGLEISTNNQPPSIPALLLMRKIQNVEVLGLYCKENSLDSHVDITCYSISSEPLCFQLEPVFFTFLHKLHVNYLDVDFLN